MTDSVDKDPDDRALPPDAAAEIAHQLGLTLRAVAIYPENHPRCRAAVDACLAVIARVGDITLTAHEQQLFCNGAKLAVDSRFDWLAAQLRKATLRGIEITAACTAVDLLRFARALVAPRRPDDAATDPVWPEDHPRLRALPLVFTGTFGGSGAPGGPGTGQGGAPEPIMAPGVDLPAYEASDPMLAHLRGAADIAVRYFGHQREVEVEATKEEKPTGRPEDAGIEADLDLLLAELAALPEAAAPTVIRQEVTSCDSRALAEQLLGVYLHLFGADDTAATRAAMATPLRRTIAALGADAARLLGPYVGPGDFRALSRPSDRLELLQRIDEAGQHELIRANGYLDGNLVVVGFPDSLPLAARVLADTPSGLEVLRRTVATLTEIHGTQAFAAFAHSTSLNAPSVVRAIVAVGGEGARVLVDAVVEAGRLDLFAAIVEQLLTLELPPAEQKAVSSLRLTDNGAAAYLQLLIREGRSRPVAAEVRRRSAELLRRRATAAATAGTDDLVGAPAAIADLALVPDQQTTALLRELARAPHWLSWLDGRRGVRAAARRTLRRLEEQRR